MMAAEVSLAMVRFLFGLIIGILLLPVAAYLWLSYGRPPVAAADKPLPFEEKIVEGPLQARIRHEAPQKAPIEANEATLIAGARIYREQCAYCHGLSGTPSQVGKNMFPDAPPLWEKHHDSVVGVSDDPPGETYWKVANGIRLTGMPAYKGALSETEMWQVSLLLSQADKPLPPAAIQLLKEPLSLTPGVLNLQQMKAPVPRN
ncbi:MAG TPA: cytochrome c [Acidobacteriaceae bacterium]|jgi:mono/diheme cytochrome c family protein|nr:cytochrome c [Acidobacteriaceae bacterium]